MKDLIPREVIERKIYLIRERKVMLDKDLSSLYKVPTKRLKEQVKRNIKRFPEDFMFELTMKEFEMLRSQFATSRWGGERYLPYAFTEQGVAMLSSVLNSERAIEVNIAIMRAFVRMREILLTHKDLADKIAALELKYKNHDIKFSEYDKHITAIFDAIRQPSRLLQAVGANFAWQNWQLMAPPASKPRVITGFKPT